MRFLRDVGVGKIVEQMLTSMGHDVQSMIDINPNASDISILQKAKTEERIIITMDKDFGELVFKSSNKHSGVLLLRTQDMDGEEKAEIVKYIMENHSSVIEDNFCVFQKGKLRIHSR